ncbi:MAG: histidine kinase [Bacteroidia bacterium]|nr:histidine kinase [Bacteroidia bacterium]
MLRLLCCLCLLVFATTAPLRAQQFNFRNWSVADGLAQSQVYALAEDTRGYLWAGTRGGGVSRFDGISFTTYSEENGLPGNFVRCLVASPNGSVWAGTDEGLAFFDGAKFVPVPLPGNAGLVNALLCDRLGQIWAATEDTGVVVLQNNKVVQHYYYKKGLPTDRTHALYEDADGNVWIGAENALIRIKDGKISVTDPLDGLPEKSIRGITGNRKGEIWLATYGAGIVRIDANNTLLRFDQRSGLPNNTVHDITTDADGNIWAATASGAARIQPADSGYTATTFGEREGLCSNVVMRILCDSRGNTWFGTSGGGMCRLDSERFLHFNEKSGDMGSWVYAVHADRKGNMWFATSNGGVTMYDGTYYVNYYEGAGFTKAKVRCIYEDTSGTMWFGTVGEGAYAFSNGAFTHYDRKSGLSGSFVTDILTDTCNQIWFATAGGGLCRLNKSTKKFERIGRKQGVTADRFQQLSLDAKGQMWAASLTDGVYVFAYDSEKVAVQRRITNAAGLESNSVRAVVRDAQGNMWLGTAGGGISRVNEKVTTFTKKDGLASNNIYLLQPDRNGDIWAGSERGLDRLRFEAGSKLKSVKHYGRGEGLAGIEVSLNASCMDSTGKLWFGTVYGATRYNPKEDRDCRIPPTVHITGLRLFFNPIQETPYGQGAKNWFGLPDTLVLPYNQNALRFDFTAIDLRNAEGVRFRWKLDGFDKDWSPENTERQATYSNLPPGEYTFRLQARNADGYMSKEEIFRFRITPPFWATWPFRIAAAVACILIVVIIFRWRVAGIRRRNAARIEKLKLEKNLLELEQKALRLQMNPHFIFNALQSIQGFIARNDSAEARRYLAKFGKLMRITLDNSRQQWTSVSQEAELLQHYLTLEALCLGGRFTIDIITDEVELPEATYLPVMLIQPFVENAVVHGIRHLPGEGKITVRFALTGQSLTVTVTDNGVGRKRAAQLESREIKEHESAALHITRERLLQLNEPGKPESGFEIKDLPKGTEVVITIGTVSVENG